MFRHKQGSVRLCRALVASVLATGLTVGAHAAQYEMGQGVPAAFGMYSAATGTLTRVWALSDVTTPFPSGCTNITLSPATMGMDAYKIGVATLLLAKTTNRRVRFYAHSDRDGGCGVDYLQLE